ncbi:MAG: hypothetical protein ACE5M4_05405 [Anaerolineales bacterium]
MLSSSNGRHPVEEAANRMMVLITRSEWKWLLGAVAVILLLTSLPVISGHVFEPNDRVFNGAIYDRYDYSVHLASMQHGARGNWTYQFMYTTEEGGEAYLKLSYILMGQLAGALGLDLAAAYQLFRLLTGGIALVAVYFYMAHGFNSVALRRTGFALAAAASGIGWLLLILGWLPQPQVSPIDFWLIDVYVFFSIATFPHFSMMMVLLMAMALGYLRFAMTKKVAYWLVAVLAGLIMLPLQPFTVALGDLAAFGAILAAWRARKYVRILDLGPYLVLVAFQLPAILYYRELIETDPIWSEFASQNVVLSPSPIYFLFGIGLVAPLAIWGAWIAYKRRMLLGLQSLFWSASALLLSFSPTLIQRRFALALMVPMALLATTGLGYGFLPALRKTRHAWVRPRRGTLLMLCVAATLPSTLYLATGGALYASITPETLYDPTSLHDAINWLSETATPSEAVMASEETGLMIPAFAGIRAFVGHPMETLRYENKVELAERFFASDGMTVAERRELLRDCSCDWVLVGPYEHSDSSLRLPDELLLRYDRGGVKIYQHLNNDEI